MRKLCFSWVFISLGFIILGFDGCAGAKKEIQSEPARGVVMPNPTEVMAAQIARTPVERYTVKRYDTLWGIAGNVYKDSFQWPMIFKANRDQIQDPDLIYPKQVFVIDRNGDAAASRALAMKTPKYSPHTRPRAKLPLAYF